MTKRVIVLTALMMILGYFAISQAVLNDYPEVSHPCPDFVLKNINYYPKRQASLNDFKEKFVILDFWNKHCIACVASFPKTNKLLAQFKDKVNIILVGKEEAGIEVMYEKFKERLNLELPVAYDSSLYNRFVVAGAPHLLWIDSKGIVQAITTSTELTAENIEAFISERKFRFYDRGHKAVLQKTNSYDENVPFLINGNGGDGSEFSYRSLLTLWQPHMPFFGFMEQIEYSASDLYPTVKGRFEGCGGLKTLYSLAYTGYSRIRFDNPMYKEFYHSPILALKDSAEFLTTDMATGRGIYCYSLIVPAVKARTDYLMDVMQRDLQNYFGYNVIVQTRKMPYWRLVATKRAKKELKTKGGAQSYNGSHAGFVYKNVPVEKLLFKIYSEHQLDFPFIDETGIENNIDIEVNAILTDLNEIIKALEKQGLGLVKGEKEMKVLVISDGK